MSALWYELLNGKIQITSTKFFILLNNLMNRVIFLAVKDHILDLIDQVHTKQFNRAGESQITIINDRNRPNQKTGAVVFLKVLVPGPES